MMSYPVSERGGISPTPDDLIEHNQVDLFSRDSLLQVIGHNLQHVSGQSPRLPHPIKTALTHVHFAREPYNKLGNIRCDNLGAETTIKSKMGTGSFFGSFPFCVYML